MREGQDIAFDGWLLHPTTGELFRDGACLRLQERSLQILTLLLSQPGQLVTREELIAHLWPKGVVDYDTGINTAMRKLRIALNDDPDAPRYIETVPRKGYRFIGKIEPATPLPAVEGTLPAVEGMGERRTIRGYRVAIAAVIAIGLFVGAITLYEWRASITRAATPAAPRTAIAVLPSAQTTSASASEAAIVGSPSAAPAGALRLAVLPFENLSPDPANAFFADGMHEEVLSALAGTAADIGVISRTTMMQYRGASKSLPELAKELRVTHVLEGTVRREGQTVRLTVQLIEARNDAPLWSQRYDRELVSAMSLQSEVASAVASQLATKLLATSGELPLSSNPEASDLYLKARILQQSRTPGSQAARQELLDRAIELDPLFAAAYVLRSGSRTTQYTSNNNLTEANLQAARADLDTARRLVGDAPLVLRAQASYALNVEWDANKVRALIERPAMVMSRNAFVQFTRANMLANLGQAGEALALFREAADLDPRNQNLFNNWGAMLWAARKPMEALRVTRPFAELRIRSGFDVQLRGSRADLTFAFTGNLADFVVMTESEDAVASSDADAQLLGRFRLLRRQNRVTESKTLVERSDLKLVRQQGFSGMQIPGIGPMPIDDLRGWANLLSKDAAAARRNGRAVLDFVAREPATKGNTWYLRLLAADGALFVGDKAQAIADARAALELAPVRIHVGISRFARVQVATILAWAGAEDEAVALLEELSAGFPGLGPAEITRDPQISMPLANNARYKRLAEKLEAEIAENVKLL